MQSLESHKRQIFKKSKNRIEGLQKNITLTETNHPLQKRQSKKLIKHSKILSDGKKRKQYDLEASNFFDANDSNYEEKENLSDQQQRNSYNFTKAESKSNLGYDNLLLDTIKSRFLILIEPSLCLAFGGCETIAPKVFVVDKNKHINPKARVLSETADTLDRIVMAAQACLTKAIKILDRYTGNQIYP